MGCVHSSKRGEVYKEDNKKYLTAALSQLNQNDLTCKEKRIVKETWTYMTKDLAENGLQVFLRIFELCPDVKKLFHVEDVRHSELSKNKQIRAHGQRFILAIGAAVHCLNDEETDKDELNKILLVLGQQHKHFSGFLPEYFEVFYEALMWRWEICMGEKFTKEVSNTWSHVFFYMMEKLKEGHNSPS
ncbi:neuroglobin-like [Ruditapes philippinarum]|uniref:neuroglobin-like n=1 Tax=Ruditapes philippinarum TaxID=129788 RepID=UPI00295B9C38|nr:neuroglobin-like [Ruditapes philippinarum]